MTNTPKGSGNPKHSPKINQTKHISRTHRYSSTLHPGHLLGRLGPNTSTFSRPKPGPNLGTENNLKLSINWPYSQVLQYSVPWAPACPKVQSQAPFRPKPGPNLG